MAQQSNPNEHDSIPTGLTQDKHIEPQERLVKATKNYSEKQSSTNYEKMDTNSTKTRDKSEKDVSVMDNSHFRPVTPQPMDMTEIAEEVKSKLHIVEDVDKDDAGDPNFCTEYVQEIYQYLYQLEVRGCHSELTNGGHTILYYVSFVQRYYH